METRSFMKREFSHNGRSLELRAVHSMHVWRVAVFENGIPLGVDVARLSEIEIEAAVRKQGVDLLEDRLVEIQQAIEGGEIPLPPTSIEERPRGWRD